VGQFSIQLNHLEILMKQYRFSLIFSAICLGLAGYWGHRSGMGLGPALWIAFVLGLLEISLSFDNAVVNASVLKTMDPFWQKMFLTIGILIAVFGMRLVFPIVIVAVMTGLSSSEVINLALNDAEQYGEILTSAYPMIAAFGGAFLLMVFFKFAFDHEREIYWLSLFERPLAKLGKLESLEIILALTVVIVTAFSMPGDLRFDVMLAGVAGIILFVLISSLDGLFKMATGTAEENTTGASDITKTVARNGLMAFLYLEVLDASFSFDGVIGAFAITRDVVIIMLGLAIGAIFVRSITIDLVRRDALDQYIYLEHGAMYAIGVLAIIMFIGTKVHVPEVLTGCIGAAFIAAAFYSSLRHRRLKG
jgi:hypothetical protein